jgi:DNA-binding IclR family transcriptional regulator
VARSVTKQTEPGRAQSVKRALGILEEIGNQSHEIGIVDLSAKVGLPVSTVHRLLATLMDSGYVVQNHETGRYRVGVRAFEIGNSFLKQTHLLDVVRPRMTQLSRQLKETVNLAVRDGNTAVYIDQVESDHPLKLFTRRGTRVPLYCTGVGKVFLAAYSELEFDSYLRATDLEPRTPHTYTSPLRLRQHLDEICTRGYAIDDEDFQIGVRCSAAPIYDHTGDTVAALSVSGPLHRINDDQLQLMLPRLTDTTTTISRELGLDAGFHL